MSTLLSLGVAVLICHSCHLAVHRDFDDTMADFRVSPTQSATKARISKGECPNADASMFIAHHEEKIWWDLNHTDNLAPVTWLVIPEQNQAGRQSASTAYIPMMILNQWLHSLTRAAHAATDVDEATWPQQIYSIHFAICTCQCKSHVCGYTSFSLFPVSGCHRV